MNSDSVQVSRLEVVDTGRRRRWTPEEKLRIVEESLSGRRQASRTARRYRIPNSLMFRRCKAYREGRLGPAAVGGGFARGCGCRRSGARARRSGGAMTIAVPSRVRVWLAGGVTDMRLSLQVQQGLGQNRHAGDLFVFRGAAAT